jgi:peptide/nickel transport system substrate-binding protein
MTGLVMNARAGELFADWRVRDAMILAFNFEFINDTVTGASSRAWPPTGRTRPRHGPGPAEGRVAEFLEPYASELLPGALEGYALPAATGRAQPRQRRGGARAAGGGGLDRGRRRRAEERGGQPFAFEVLLQSGSTEVASMVDIYVQSLQRLGMQVTVEQVDAAQYKERTDAYDFDVTYYRRDLSLSPGNEQTLYFGSATADEPAGATSWRREPGRGRADPAPPASEETADFVAATQALDRCSPRGAT